MEESNDAEDNKVRESLYRLIVSQLRFDAHTSLAEDVRNVTCLGDEVCEASAELLRLLCAVVTTKVDAEIQCDVFSDRMIEADEAEISSESKRSADAATQTESAVDDAGTTCEETGPREKRRGRARKSAETASKPPKERRKGTRLSARRNEDSDLLGSKRKQRNPQKVVSPDRAPSAAKHVASPDHVTSERVTRRAAGKPESQPEADVADPNLGDQDAAQNESKDPDDPDDEVLFTPPAKKKPRRSRAVREKAAPSAKPRAEKENFRFATGSGRGTSGKRHTVCYGCDMTFEKSTDCHAHVLTHFEDRDSHKVCLICGKTLAKTTMHQDHLKIHSSIKTLLCNICGATFNRKSSYDNHMEKHSRKKLYCEKCSNGPYNTAKQYERHLAVFHGGPVNKKWMCDICGKPFYQKNKLDSHVRIHTGERPYTCSFCPATFRCKPHVQRHEEQHGGKKRFTCGVCNHATFQRSNMKVHMRVHSAASYAETRLVVCALCRSCFHATDLFETHKAARHPNYEQDVDALTDTIGIGKIKMLINPPNRQSSSSTSATTSGAKTPRATSDQSGKPKRTPRVRACALTVEDAGVAVPPTVTEVETRHSAGGSGAMQQSHHVVMTTLAHAQPSLVPQQTQSNSATNMAATVVSVNNAFHPAVGPTLHQVGLYSIGATPQAAPPISTAHAHPPPPGHVTYPVPGPAAVVSDGGILVHAVATGSNAPGAPVATGGAGGVHHHPGFLQQHQQPFTNVRRLDVEYPQML